VKKSAAYLLGFLFLCSVVRADPQTKISEILGKLPKRSKSTVLISAVSGSALKTVFEHKPDLALRPASNMKLLTIALALEKLGPDYLHKTSLQAAGPIERNGIQGAVHIIGRGDPNLSRRFRNPKDRSLDVPILSRWSRMLLRRGIGVINGDLVIDDRFFDQVRYHPDWEKADRPHWYAAEVSALILNDGCVDIEIVPSKSGGTIRLYPPTKYLRVTNKLSSTSSARSHVFSVRRQGNSRDLLVKGKIWSKAKSGRTEITVPDPSMYFGTAFKESLERAGIKVTGRVRRIRAGEKAGGERLAENTTPLPLTLAICGKRSLNHYAESLLKTVAREKAGAGTYAKGTAITKQWLEEMGVKTSSLAFRDGSGLSRKNRINARAIHTLLWTMYKSKNAVLYRSCLTVGGIDGTLRKRFRKLPSGYRVEAKTGTLRDTSALSGYLISTNAAGEKSYTIFSILMNDLSPSLARKAQEEIVMALCKK
jgi:serine-type D-Ala-D-Ala carboxypeptidase/endopeptidase (penicillin-binding protein 4)